MSKLKKNLLLAFLFIAGTAVLFLLWFVIKIVLMSGEFIVIYPSYTIKFNDISMDVSTEDFNMYKRIEDGNHLLLFEGDNVFVNLDDTVDKVILELYSSAMQGGSYYDVDTTDIVEYEINGKIMHPDPEIKNVTYVILSNKGNKQKVDVTISYKNNNLFNRFYAQDQVYKKYFVFEW